MAERAEILGILTVDRAALRWKCPGTERDKQSKNVGKWPGMHMEGSFYPFQPVCNILIRSNDGLLTVIQNKEMELMQA